MVIYNEAIFKNRKHAAYLLGERLREYNKTDAVVLAVPGGGIHMGSYLSQLLELPLDVIPCKKIKHPADPNKTVGAVSSDSVVVCDAGHELPQDYLYHQIQMLQHVIRMQHRNYDKERKQVSLHGKTVIVVDDMLKTGDTMLACLKSLRKQLPDKIVVAVPNVTPQAIRAIAGEIDAIIYLTIEPKAIENLYSEFPEIGEEEVLKILRESSVGPREENY
ncbi:MAG: phosphoribosyltransferase family protein [Chryseolinea sp.]